MPKVEMAVRSITESSRRRPNSLVQSPNQRDFSGNTENTRRLSAFIRLDLNIDHDGNDDTGIFENVDDDFRQ